MTLVLKLHGLMPISKEYSVWATKYWEQK